MCFLLVLGQYKNFMVQLKFLAEISNNKQTFYVLYHLAVKLRGVIKFFMNLYKN